MLFSSITFLYYFLPAVLILYFVLPAKFKNAVILFSSLLFYSWGEPKCLLIMVGAILQGYILGILTEKAKQKHHPLLAKSCCAASVVLSLGMLGVFKYTDFFIDNINTITGMQIPLLHIALPIGISFYTFQILSYTVDVYRGTCPPQRNIISFGAYVAMFPQLIAGPIVRYCDIERELMQRSYSLQQISEGFGRFVVGLSKKVLIANVLGELTSAFHSAEEKSVLYVWLYAIAYTLHVYFDFSGYSDMAIGLGRIMGFHFPENFNYPLISASITEFWRRWHMSLGTWFRDYLYIPMGGNRVSKSRWIFNILVVWMATGFWHGAAWNFIIWGLLFAVLLALEKIFLLKQFDRIKWIRHIYVSFFIIISFVIFDNTVLKDGIQIIGSMFGFGNIPLMNQESIYLLRSYGPIMTAALIGATPLPVTIVRRIREKFPKTINALEPLFLISIFLIVTSFLIDGSFNPFLYFRF